MNEARFPARRQSYSATEAENIEYHPFNNLVLSKRLHGQGGQDRSTTNITENQPRGRFPPCSTAGRALKRRRQSPAVPPLPPGRVAMRFLEIRCANCSRPILIWSMTSGSIIRLPHRPVPPAEHESLLDEGYYRGPSSVRPVSVVSRPSMPRANFGSIQRGRKNCRNRKLTTIEIPTPVTLFSSMRCRRRCPQESQRQKQGCERMGKDNQTK